MSTGACTRTTATRACSRPKRCAASPAATGARYVAQLKLQGYSQGAKGRFGFLGLRIVETHYADVRVFLQVWDGRDGSIAWEAMQELRIARESMTEEPLMLRQTLERSARELITRLP